MKKLFGTDGIRAIANAYPITPEMCVKIAIASGKFLLKNSKSQKHRVIIAKDTRLSGYLIETALTSGFISIGIDVMLLGPVPTPAVSMLVKSMRADLGIMISASHNLYQYNGIKIFSSDGNKLSEDAENFIENTIFENDLSYSPEELGKCYRIDGAGERYIEFVKNTIKKDISFEKCKIVIDSANGASYKIAKTVLWELGFEIISMHDTPNGSNINEKCGATCPEEISKKVVETKSDVGIALDGDSDRVIMCDENGKIVDGDMIIAIIAKFLKHNHNLKNNHVVVTSMSNLGMENYLKSIGIETIRTDVGDKYVVRKMLELKSNLGGEQSGHIILTDYNNTGDGLVAALQILYIMQKENKKLSELIEYTPTKQLLKNLRLDDIDFSDEKIQKIENFKSTLENGYRILVRKSGTEPLIRILVEGENEKTLNEIYEKLESIIKK